jgi:hypothetical protein
MNAITQEFRTAGRNLAATPAAVFLAVLTAGFALASTAHHMGLYCSRSFTSGQGRVVLACPRSSTAKSAATGAHGSAPRTVENFPAAAPNNSAGSATPVAAVANGSPERRTAGKSGGRGISMPLPEFNAPELSRFISPL